MSSAITDNSGVHFSAISNSDIEALLASAFGAEFSLWNLVHSSNSDAGPGTSGPTLLNFLLDDETIRQMTENDAGPRVVEASPGKCLLALPFACQQKVELIATATIQSSEPELLLRLARQFVERQRLTGEIVNLTGQIDQFAERISDDMEELTILRSMAEQLEVSEASSNLTGVAKCILPLLCESIKSKTIALLLADESDADLLSANVVLTVGTDILDEKEFVELVNRFQTDARLRPVVRNRCWETDMHSALSGVREFILVPMSKTDRTLGWLLAVNRADIDPTDAPEWQLSSHEFGSSEATLLSSAASVLATHAVNVELFQQKEQLLFDVVRALVHAVEAKDQYTRGHSERVALYAQQLASEFGLSQTECRRLYLTGLLHDVGKIGVKDNTLTKPGRLSDEEFEEIKRHPDEGWAILDGLDQLNYVLPGMLYHHERWDGKGYPDGLAGEDIPLDGRILAVVDAYDAMTSDRPYRNGMAQEKAEAILRDGAGSQWDPTLIETFLRATPEILKIRESYKPRQKAPRKKEEEITGAPDVLFNGAVPWNSTSDLVG